MTDISINNSPKQKAAKSNKSAAKKSNSNNKDDKDTDLIVSYLNHCRDLEKNIHTIELGEVLEKKLSDD